MAQLPQHDLKILAILNCTPDSFSDGVPELELFHGPDSARAAAAQPFVSAAAAALDTADGIDIGGESTAPGRLPIASDEEIARIKPAVEYFAHKTFVSVDTYKAATAKWAVEHGAKMINDVSALRADPKMAAVIADSDASVVLMFSKQSADSPHATRAEKNYSDVIADIRDFLSSRIDYALSQGIPAGRIVLDPGMGGFVSPDPKYSWELLARLPELRSMFAEFPFLIGTSRKGFLGGELAARDPASQLTGLIAHLQGVEIIRTHNPKMAREFFSIWGKVYSAR